MTLTTITDSSVSLNTVASEPRDVRPILPRSATNAWERTDDIRAGLYSLLELLCAKRDLTALVLQSQAYVHPAWVKFESWLPTGEPGITARSAMTVSISTRPYHRFETIYKVEWEKHGHKGAIDHLYEFDEPQMNRMIDFLLAAPTPSRAARAVKRILKPVQLRQQWWQLWKPKNKVSIIRRDWLAIGSMASVALGATLIGVGLVGSTAASEDTFAFAPAVDPIGQEQTAPVLSPPATSPPARDNQPPAQNAEVDRGNAGETFSGTLEETDSRMDDGRLYELRTLAARAGQNVVITMQSADFDTFLLLGQIVGGTFTTLQTNDDGGGDGTNSQLEFIAPADGEYLIVASSYQAGKTGRYSIAVR